MSTPTVQLSPHFTLAELTTTEVRAYIESNAQPPMDVRANLAKLCTQLLEPIRNHFDAPLIVHSGYRSRQLNQAIGGSRTSQHMKGEAADFHVVGVKLTDVFHWLLRERPLQVGQCLLEGWAVGNPTWIHISLERDGGPERNNMFMTMEQGRYRRLA